MIVDSIVTWILYNIVYISVGMHRHTLFSCADKELLVKPKEMVHGRIGIESGQIEHFQLQKLMQNFSQMSM